MEYVILTLALAGIVLGADTLVSGAVSVAKRFGMSDFLIGALIVGVGTSLPELTVSFSSAMHGNPDVAIGNVVGSNIFNILGILGLTALFFPVSVSRNNMRFEIPFCIFVSVLSWMLTSNFFNGSPAFIGRADGIVLLLCFAFFMWYSLRRDMQPAAENAANPAANFAANSAANPAANSAANHAAEPAAKSDPAPLWIAFLKVAAGLAVLIISCELFVDKAIVIAKAWGMSEAVIAITLIACGTSLPELAASIAAALRKNTQLALGNVIGSNIFNLTLILGLSSQAGGLTSSGITDIDFAVMTAAAMLPLFFGIRGRIGRAGGTVMLLAFVVYNIYLIQ